MITIIIITTTTTTTTTEDWRRTDRPSRVTTATAHGHADDDARLLQHSDACYRLQFCFLYFALCVYCLSIVML